jgi:hypothetical protein
MKKFLLLFLLVAAVVVIIGPLAPYWFLMICVAILSFVVGAGNFSSMMSAGFSFGLTWLILSLYISIKTESDMPKRMAELMGIGNDNLLWFGTSILGLVIGLFSGLTGAMFRKLFKR